MLRNVNWIFFKNPYFYPRIMRIKVILTDEIINADSNMDLVRQLWEGSFTTDTSLFEYMKSYARRAVAFNNDDIRATSVDEFVEDLKTYKHIEIIDS
ncbi:conserved hypothetical protein [Tenacibaculum maritimum]|nr:conserved hypothetical protein [Tenacibaculum maritimum]